MRGSARRLAGRMTTMVERAAPAGSDFAELSRRINAAGLLQRRPAHYAVRLSAVAAALVAGWSLFFAVGASWWTLAVAVACTCAPIVLLLLGMPLTKAATASLISCAEPVTAVVIGAAFYGDVFGGAQLIGAASVVCAVVLLELRGRRAITRPAS